MSTNPAFTSEPLRDRFLRLPEVLYLTGLSRSTVYQKVAAGTFPRQIRLGQNIVVWRESEVIRWMEDPT